VVSRRPLNHGFRRRVLLAGLVLTALIMLGRGFQLQVLEGDRWAERAEEQQKQRIALPAARGTIFDRDGVPLVVSREAYRVAVAPREVRDRAAAERRLREALRLSASEVRRALDPRRRWVVLPGRYDAVVKERLEGIRGIHFERVSERFYPHGSLALELLGQVSADGRALGGIELELDSILRGKPGWAVVRRDARGPIPGALVSVAEPEPGHDVFLTIDLDLQEIAEEALREAVEQTGAAGGDLLMTDPHTGEILAAVSHRTGAGRQWSAVVEPYEPGSTLKPFFVAALLASGRATMQDSVFAENGRYVANGRTIRDVTPHGWLTVREALRVSSNVAMAKLSERLDAADQFAYLRDFGFGSPTGVAFPSESSGRLRRPSTWSKYSAASLSIGYEIAVTPLQMAMAYGALANGGVLMAPRLIREVRTRDGKVLWKSEPEPVRRVVPPEVAQEIAAALVEVVEQGTGREAALGEFGVAGKTGTARRAEGGRYEAGAYTASFAGFFPASDPQLTILVKLDRPKSQYYGGLAAAPVTRATLAAALAARNTPLDRRAVARRVGVPGGGEVVAGASPVPGSAARNVVLTGSGGAEADRGAAHASGPYVFALNSSQAPKEEPAEPAAQRPVPRVIGLPMRDAVRRLHAQGFRVRVEGSGAVSVTDPAPGVLAEPGAVVRVRGREGS